MPKEINFSGITLANQKPLGRNFTGRRRVRWHALLQTFSSLRRTVAKWRQKPHFANFLSQKKQCIVSSTSLRLTVKVEHKTWMGVITNSFGTKLRNFSDNGSFTPPQKKTSIVVFCDTPWLLDLGRIWALHVIVTGLRVFPRAVTFSYDFPFSRHRRAKSPLISGASQTLAIFRLPLQRRFTT